MYVTLPVPWMVCDWSAVSHDLRLRSCLEVYSRSMLTWMAWTRFRCHLIYTQIFQLCPNFCLFMHKTSPVRQTCGMVGYYICIWNQQRAFLFHFRTWIVGRCLTTIGSTLSCWFLTPWGLTWNWSMVWCRVSSDGPMPCRESMWAASWTGLSGPSCSGQVLIWINLFGVEGRDQFSLCQVV